MYLIKVECEDVQLTGVAQGLYQVVDFGIGGVKSQVPNLFPGTAECVPGQGVT